MPTYEYRCPSCGHEFECFQKMSDEPVAECPECEAAAERLLSAGGGLLFKGEGFYITDYRSSDYKKQASADAGDGGGGGADKSAGASKTESASKSETASKSGVKSKSDSGSSSTSSSSAD